MPYRSMFTNPASGATIGTRAAGGGNISPSLLSSKSPPTNFSDSVWNEYLSIISLHLNTCIQKNSHDYNQCYISIFNHINSTKHEWHLLKFKRRSCSNFWCLIDIWLLIQWLEAFLQTDFSVSFSGSRCLWIKENLINVRFHKWIQICNTEYIRESVLLKRTGLLRLLDLSFLTGLFCPIWYLLHSAKIICIKQNKHEIRVSFKCT